MATNVFHNILHLFYPRICPGCGGDSIGKDEQLCLKCLNALPVTRYHLSRDNKIEQMFYGRIHIEAAMSFLYFSKHSLVQNLMHEFKYNGRKDLGLFLGQLMGRAIEDSKVFNQCDVLVPLPLHPDKQKRRGYNQAEILCRGIHMITGQPVVANSVIRNIKTESQTRKDRIDRWKNVEHTFSVSDEVSLKGKHILLIDDVITTGATLEACAAAILNTGPATKVSIATLAVATK
ncbi:MAG: ComF family protein [Chitinophagaceae bacterium]|nr:ComF family protein [Chitinophagaceae bacterium]